MNKTKERRDPMTPGEVAALSPHAGWIDGREGCLFCRFDAIVDPDRMLRAEITWLDDLEGRDAVDAGSEPTVYYAPVLFLESNRPPAPADRSGFDEYVTWDGVHLPLDREAVVSLVSDDPRRVVERYAGEISRLDVWDESKGYGDGPHARSTAPEGSQ